jgi:hypothetical protein
MAPQAWPRIAIFPESAIVAERASARLTALLALLDLRLSELSKIDQ